MQTSPTGNITDKKKMFVFTLRDAGILPQWRQHPVFPQGEGDAQSQQLPGVQPRCGGPQFEY